MELKLISITLGLARDAISSGCKTRQYPFLGMIKLGTYTSKPRTSHPQLELQDRRPFSGRSVHSSGCQIGLSQPPCSSFASRHQCIRQLSAGRHQHNRQRSSGRIRCSQNRSALSSRYIRQPCSVLHQYSHWQSSLSNRYIRQLCSVQHWCSHWQSSWSNRYIRQPCPEQYRCSHWQSSWWNRRIDQRCLGLNQYNR